MNAAIKNNGTTAPFFLTNQSGHLEILVPRNKVRVTYDVYTGLWLAGFYLPDLDIFYAGFNSGVIYPSPIRAAFLRFSHTHDRLSEIISRRGVDMSQVALSLSDGTLRFVAIN